MPPHHTATMEDSSMTAVRIRSFEVASHKLDDAEPPSYGTMNIEVGGVPLRLFLQQEQIDALVEAAEPIALDVLRDVRDAMGARIVA
jgi:hypothetical protein